MRLVAPQGALSVRGASGVGPRRGTVVDKARRDSTNSETVTQGAPKVKRRGARDDQGATFGKATAEDVLDRASHITPR